MSKICKYFVFQILPTDKCSQNVCRLCASKVVEYKIFRKRAIATQDNISDYQQINAQVLLTIIDFTIRTVKYIIPILGTTI